MSSELFEGREEDFRSLYDGLRRKVDEQIPRVVGEERKRVCREVERGLEEGSLVIQEMENETKKAPPSYRTQMVTRVRNYKRDLELLEKKMKQHSNGTPSRDNFGFARQDDFETMESSQRSRLLAGQDVLTRTSDSIARSQRVAAETDVIGHDIIDELGTQRESLVRTQTRLHDTDAELGKSRKILKSMARRVMTNKMILAFIIFLEVCILGGVVYWKFFRKSK